MMIIRTGIRAGALTVYGTQGCSWTQKQLDYLKKKGIQFKYVDCDKTGCPDFVQGFPTLDLNGKISSGYQEI